MNIGEKLYALRKEKHLSQEEAANLLNVTRQTISKWETNQSTPDFDKILPLCKLYGISPNELLSQEQPEPVQAPPVPAEDYAEKPEREDGKATQKRALGIAAGVMCFILSVVWIMISVPVLKMNASLAAAIMLGVIAVGVGIIVYSSIVYPSQEKQEEKKKENSPAKQINEILAGIVLAVYLLISFITGYWHITWIIWVIYGVIAEIVKLALMLRGDKND